MDDLQRLKNSHIQKIRELYECEIERKYKDIAQIKATMHSMLEELGHCVYSEHGLTKVLRVDREVIEEDTNRKEHPFTKRSFVRRRLTKRTIYTTKNKPLDETSSSQEDSLVLKVLQINKRLAQKQSRISSVSEEEDQPDQKSSEPSSPYHSPKASGHYH